MLFTTPMLKSQNLIDLGLCRIFFQFLDRIMVLYLIVDFSETVHQRLHLCHMCKNGCFRFWNSVGMKAVPPHVVYRIHYVPLLILLLNYISKLTIFLSSSIRKVYFGQKLYKFIIFFKLLCMGLML